MTKDIRAAVLGTGSYLPQRVLTNADLEKMVDTSDEWIRTRTGIRERHIASPEEATSDLAVCSALKALEAARLKVSDIDIIMTATITPDMPTPSASCFMQAKLGAPQAAAFDLSAACAGFVYGLATAKAFIESGQARYVLLTGSEKLTAFVDWTDRGTCVLFGDGAGSAVIGPARREGSGILSTFLTADGTQADLLKIPAGGSRLPNTVKTIEDRMNCLKMAGPEVFKIAVKVMTDACHEALKRADVTLEQIRQVIPHQANIRIINAVRGRLGLPEDRFFVNIDRVGNTSAASVAIAFDEAIKSEHLNEGDCVLLVTFGAGLTLGASVIRL